MTDFLTQVVAERRDYVAEAKARRPIADVLGAAPITTSRTDGFAMALRHARATRGLALIAEVKRRSPALGTLVSSTFPVGYQAYLYSGNGAAAISVLTEPNHWGGSLDDVREVREKAPRTPVLAKDVIVDEYQIAEAREAGASAVLLIAEALDDATLSRLRRFAASLGMGTLVEAHEAAAFGRAAACGSQVVGVNARDLRDPKTIDIGRVRMLHTFARQEQVLVAESGIEGPEDVRMLPARVDAILVGTALMRAADPGYVVKQLLSVRAPAVNV